MSDERQFIGIDPGGSGAIAVLRVCTKPIWIKNDVTERDLADWLIAETSVEFTSVALIEKVHSMPKQGVSSSFKFGQSYGFLRGLLIGLKVPFEEVSPQKWQGALGCRSGGDKNVTKAAAQRLWPDLKITHANADALLIAEYLRRWKTFGLTVAKQPKLGDAFELIARLRSAGLSAWDSIPDPDSYIKEMRGANE